MQKVKKSWNASGKRHAISRGANEKPSVSQFEMLKPVIQFATNMSAEIHRKWRYAHTHLNDDKLSSTIHLACLSLPDSSRGRVHASTKSSHNAPNHHTRYGPTACLDDCANTDDCRAKYNLPWTSEDVASPDGRHCPNEASNVVYGGHYTLHIRGRISERMKEILRDNDIAEHTLIVTIKAARRQIGTTRVVRIASYMSTVLAAMEIHTVSRSPEPPRYLRAMVECCLSRYHCLTQNAAVVAGKIRSRRIGRKDPQTEGCQQVAQCRALYRTL